MYILLQNKIISLLILRPLFYDLKICSDLSVVSAVSKPGNPSVKWEERGCGILRMKGERERKEHKILVKQTCVA